MIKDKIKWDLLGKYLSGECDEKEKRNIEDWIKAKSSNKDLFEELNNNNELLKQITNMQKVNADEAWIKLKKRIISSDHSSTFAASENTKTISRKSYIPYIRVAASIIFIIGLYVTFLFINKNYFNKDEYFHNNGTEIAAIILPDGSKVILNTKSKLSYPRKFDTKNRIVYLDGEAFFYVKSLSDIPFVVKVDDKCIKVVGTSFNIKNKPNKEIEVLVQTGKVKIYKESDEDKGLIVNPGELGKSKNNSIYKKINTDKNYIAWMTKKLNFNDGLKVVAEILEEVYKVDIKFENKNIEKCQFRGIFTNAELELILETISLANDLTYSESSGNIVFYGHGCLN